MRKGKTASMIDEDISEEIIDFFDELHLQKEDEKIRQGFDKFLNHIKELREKYA